MVAAPKLERITVAEAAERYLRNVQRAVLGGSLAKTTADNYTRDLAEFVELAGETTILDDLTAENVDDIVLAYGSKPDGRFTRPRPGREEVPTRSAGAQARFRQSVANLFREAALEGWVESSPMPRTKVRPRAKGLKNVARKALPEPAAAGLLEVPAAREARRADQLLVLRDIALLRILLECGLRVSELCNANRSDLERRSDGTWWLSVLGKGAKERWVPLSDAPAAAYADYVEHERPPAKARSRYDERLGKRVVVDAVDDAERALFLTWRGVRMKSRDVQLMVKRAVSRLPADIRREVTPHGLRHTCATLLLSSGAADVKTVKDMLGHESLATTGVYLDTIYAEMAAAVRAHPITGDHRSAS